MSNILSARVSIRGIRPLFFHAFGPGAIPLDKRKERTGVAGHDPEEWRQTCLVNEEGQLYITDQYIFSALRNGAKYTKRGRKSLQSDVSATLQCLDRVITLDRWMPGFPSKQKCIVKELPPPPQDSSLPVYLDVRSVVNPSTKGRNIRYRIVASQGWICVFTVCFDKTLLSRGEVEAIVRDAGQFVGLGSARAIGMGRFELVGFEVAE